MPRGAGALVHQHPVLDVNSNHLISGSDLYSCRRDPLMFHEIYRLPGGIFVNRCARLMTKAMIVLPSSTTIAKYGLHPNALQPALSFGKLSIEMLTDVPSVPVFCDLDLTEIPINSPVSGFLAMMSKPTWSTYAHSNPYLVGAKISPKHPKNAFLDCSI